MQVTPEITYKNLQPTDRIKDRVEKEMVRLEEIYPRLIACKVALEGPTGRRRHGELIHVRLHLVLPGGQQVAVSHHNDDNHAHEDVIVAIRDAFRAAERQLKKAKPDPQTEGAAARTRLAGEIARFLAEERAGFIRSEDGAEFYFHEREVTDTPFERLTIGDPVTFRPEEGEKGPMARAVHKRQDQGPTG